MDQQSSVSATIASMSERTLEVYEATRQWSPEASDLLQHAFNRVLQVRVLWNTS